MLTNIKTIIYQKATALAMLEYLKIEILEDKNILEFVDSRYRETIEKPKSIDIEEDYVESYIDKLFRIIDGWENIYEDNKVIDGVSWKLEIIYMNGENEHYSGKNRLPSNFEYLDKIKYEIIDKVMEF